MEKDIQKYLSKSLSGNNCLVIKIILANIIGIPDLLVISPATIFMIEVKSETGRLSPAQSLMIKRLREHGMKVYVITGMEEAKQFILGRSV